MKLQSNILKLALFATGLSGIVAEYILATLATYFLGNSVLQWSLIVSVMMFSMGIGSRISRVFRKNLLQVFIFTEFALSFLVAFSSVAVYSAASYTIYIGFIIYSLSIVIGILIGMEIPLVARLNEEFESLRVNIANVIEKDYYGSLAGGLFFVFVGLPYLGLTYTPFILGTINFLVALVLLYILYGSLTKKQVRTYAILGALVASALFGGFFIAEPIILFGEQNKYKDKVIFTEQTKYQRIVITQWKDHHWLFLNGNQQLSSFDEVMYHEPLVHPVMQLSKMPENVLVMGGGDGCAAREILKYPSVKKITLIDIDPVMTDLAKTHPVLTGMNKFSLNNPKVNVQNRDGYTFLEQTTDFYDVIIIDLPDPRSVELGRLYSREFYEKCRKQLRPNGVIVTQAGSPYYATNAFLCIDKTMNEAGFETKAIHNQILTMGQWAWVIGVKNMSATALEKNYKQISISDVDTEWLNDDMIDAMTYFGKNIYPYAATDSIEVNSIHNPVLYKYYLKGNWDLY